MDRTRDDASDGGSPSHITCALCCCLHSFRHFILLLRIMRFSNNTFKMVPSGFCSLTNICEEKQKPHQQVCKPRVFPAVTVSESVGANAVCHGLPRPDLMYCIMHKLLALVRSGPDINTHVYATTALFYSDTFQQVTFNGCNMYTSHAICPLDHCPTPQPFLNLYSL